MTHVGKELPLTLDVTGPTTVLIGQQADGQLTLRVMPQEVGAGAPVPSPAAPQPRSPRPSSPRTRVRPTAWTPSDVLLVAGSAVSSAFLTGLVLHVLSTSPGWLADGLVWYAVTLAMVYALSREQGGTQAAIDRVVTIVISTGALLLVVPLVSLLGYVLVRGLPHLSLGFLTHDLRGVTPDLPPEQGGGLHAIIGTLEQAGIALVLVLPLGLLTAVFLNETSSRLRRPIRIVVDAMSGLPSIVAGLFIYSALIINKPTTSSFFGFNGTMASLALALVMLPTVTRTVEVVLRLVPAGLREASLALGAGRGRTVWSVVLPTARSGVTTATVLGLARIVGETAPLLFTAFGSTLINANPLSGPQESLPLFVFRLVKSPSANESDRGYVGAVVLIALVLVLFIAARLIGRGGVTGRRRRPPRPATSSGREPAMPPFSPSTTTPTVRLEDRERRVEPIHLTGGPPEGAASIETVDLCAWFGERLVLEGVDLVMPQNHVTALIGPSGCGKSTFLRMLNRMHELVPTASLAGQVLLDGEDIYGPGMRAQRVRARVGMVFQKPNPFPAMSIHDNVLSGLKLGGLGCSDKDALVEHSLERAGLWREVRDRLDSPGGALSGGQQQRLCIARSLAVRPNVLLMDEPCSALDPTSTRRIEETIKQLSEDVTVVIVTHNMQQAQRVSDFCAFFLAAEGEPGRVLEHGRTTDVFGQPVDSRTRDYVNGRFG